MRLLDYIVERASDNLASSYMDKVASAMYMEELLEKEAGPKRSEKKSHLNQIFRNQQNSKSTKKFNQTANRTKGSIMNSAKETAEMMTDDPKLQGQLKNQVSSYVGKPNNQPIYTNMLEGKAKNEKLFNQIDGVSKDTINLGNKSAKKIRTYREMIKNLQNKIFNMGLEQKDINSKLFGATKELEKRKGIINALTADKASMQSKIDDLLKGKEAIKQSFLMAKKSRMTPRVMRDAWRMLGKTKHGRIAAGIIGGIGLISGSVGGVLAGKKSGAKSAYNDQNVAMQQRALDLQEREMQMRYALEAAKNRKGGFLSRLVG